MSFANPVFVFTIVWGMVTFLHSMHLLEVLVPMNSTTLAMILSNIIIFFLLLVFVKKIIFGHCSKTRLTRKAIDVELASLKKYTPKLLYIWILGTLANVVYSGGIPLVWMISGSGKDYTNYGIPTFGGFIAAINCFLAVSYFVIYFYEKDRKYLLLLLIQLIWPILVVSRGNFTYMLLEIVGAYLLLVRVNFKTICSSALILIAFLYIFGVIGDFRFGDKALVFKKGILSSEYVDFAEHLPSGLVYAYMYVTTPINNIVFNIDNLHPQFMPYYSTSTLFPTVLRSIIFKDAGYSLEMMSDTYNTFSFYGNYLKDFGVYVTILIISIIQLGVSILYVKAQAGRICYVLAYSVAFQCVALSIFNDNFTMQMSIFQILMSLYFGRYYKLSSRQSKQTYGDSQQPFIINESEAI